MQERLGAGTGHQAVLKYRVNFKRHYCYVYFVCMRLCGMILTSKFFRRAESIEEWIRLQIETFPEIEDMPSLNWFDAGCRVASQLSYPTERKVPTFFGSRIQRSSCHHSTRSPTRALIGFAANYATLSSCRRLMLAVRLVSVSSKSTVLLLKSFLLGQAFRFVGAINAKIVRGGFLQGCVG